MARWAEHFKGLFSDQRFVEETSLAKIPQADVKSFLDNPPTCDEIKEAIAKLKHGKSPGSDGIPAEVYQHGGDALLSRLHDLFTKCWELGVLPQDLKDATIVSLYKNKGAKSDCSNYRGITLLSIAGKILARVLLNRLIPAIAEEVMPESQCGFRANIGTSDIIFALCKYRKNAESRIWAYMLCSSI